MPGAASPRGGSHLPWWCRSRGSAWCRGLRAGRLGWALPSQIPHACKRRAQRTAPHLTTPTPTPRLLLTCHHHPCPMLQVHQGQQPQGAQRVPQEHGALHELVRQGAGEWGSVGEGPAGEGPGEGIGLCFSAETGGGKLAPGVGALRASAACAVPCLLMGAAPAVHAALFAGWTRLRRMRAMRSRLEPQVVFQALALAGLAALAASCQQFEKRSCGGACRQMRAACTVANRW